MPKEEHNRLLEQLLEEIDTFPPKKTIRLFLSGSCMDKIETAEFIEKHNGDGFFDGHFGPLKVGQKFRVIEDCLSGMAGPQGIRL